MPDYHLPEIGNHNASSSDNGRENMTDRERDAQTIIAVSRQYQSRCCAEPLPEHLAIELAAICVDATTTITEQTKAEARAILESERES